MGTNGRAISLVVAIVITLMVSRGSAQVFTVWPMPLSQYWQFNVPPLKGEVQEIETSETAKWLNKPLVTVMTFHTLPKGGRQVIIGESAVVNWDDHGRVSRIVSLAPKFKDPAKPAKREAITLTEIATYDVNGILTSIEQRDNNATATKLPIRSIATADGGRILSWPCKDNMKHEWVCELTFDKNGRLTMWDNDGAENKTMPPYIFSYNTHGDVASVKMNDQSVDYFEYQYDQTGNWTQSVRTTIRGTKKEEQETHIRKITYGRPSDGVENTPLMARSVAKPAVRNIPPNDPPAALPPAVAGAVSYRKTLGKSGSGLSNEMTVTINPDHTGAFIAINEWKEKRFTKSAICSWRMQGDALVLHLDRSTDGQAIPDEMRTLRFHKTANGDLSPDDDPQSPFVRVGS